jgi:hypothetical protein
MSLLTTCPHCRQQLSVPSLQGNVTLRCTRCEGVFRVNVPAAAATPVPVLALATEPIPVRPVAEGRTPAAILPDEDSRPARRRLPTWALLMGGGAVVGLVLALSIWGVTLLFSPAAEEPNAAPALPPAAVPKPAGGAVPAAPRANNPAAPVQAAAGKPAEGQLSVENYAKVRAGMSEARVCALLGKPNRRQVLSGVGRFYLDLAKGNDPDLRKLTWARGRRKVVLQFVNDNLIMAAAAFPEEWGDRAGPPVIEDNFRKLNFGMSEDDLRQLLGPPSYINNLRIYDNGKERGMALIWKRGRDTIEGRFLNDKLDDGSGVFGAKGLTLGTVRTRPGTPEWAHNGHARLTRAVYDALRPSVDLKDVILQLGFGNMLGRQRMADGRMSELTLEYVEGPASLTLHFVSGKLADKQAKNLPAK